jgi:hypothetical protein
MLDVLLHECHFYSESQISLYAECHDAEYRDAECHEAECRYAECRYAEGHYNECRLLSVVC